MTSWGEAAFDAYLPADMVLGQADIGVVVADRLSNLLFLNEYAVRLFRLPGDVRQLAGSPVLSLGLFAGDDLRKLEDVAGQVLRGRSWEGTFESIRGDGSRALMRAVAVPLRHPGGDIDGMVILARVASNRDGQLQQERIALLERVGERLGRCGHGSGHRRCGPCTRRGFERADRHHRRVRRPFDPHDRRIGRPDPHQRPQEGRSLRGAQSHVLDRFRHAAGKTPTAQLRLAMQKVMQNNCAVFRTGEVLHEGSKLIHDVLASVDTWDRATREVVTRRLQMHGPLRFFTVQEEPTLRAFCDVATAQDSEPRVPVAEMVDDKLAAGRLDGYRYADMPRDPDTWRLVLRGLDEVARSRYGSGGFAACDPLAREAIIAALADGSLSGGAWDGLDVSRAFSVCMRAILEAFPGARIEAVHDASADYYGLPAAPDMPDFAPPDAEPADEMEQD